MGPDQEKIQLFFPGTRTASGAHGLLRWGTTLLSQPGEKVNFCPGRLENPEREWKVIRLPRRLGTRLQKPWSSPPDVGRK